MKSAKSLGEFYTQFELADRLSQVDPQLAGIMSVSGLNDGQKRDDMVSVSRGSFKATELGPTQTSMELDYVVGTAIEFIHKGVKPPVVVGAIVSSDGRIMDGHHRWAASILAFGGKATLRAWKADLPGEKLVRVLNLLTKGKFKVNSGNEGSSSINDLTPSKVRGKLEEYALMGRSNKYFPFTPEEFVEIIELKFGDLESGMEIMSSRANLINKTVPGWAPDRKDMPVIESEQVEAVSNILGEGLLDWSAPFSDEVEPKRVAALYMAKNSPRISKTAGVVQHMKDQSGSGDNWAYGMVPGIERDIRPAFKFDFGELKPLMKSLRSCLMALGHVTSAYDTFVNIKSRKVSPDGQLGGKGYIQKISDMRRQLMNCVEALSAFTDTVYDEVNAPHWKKKQEEVNGEDKAQIEEIYEDVKEIKEDPESWAESQSFELDEENKVEVEEKLGDEGTRLSALEETRALTRAYLISKSKVGG
jgi:hypothetical protein